MKRTFTSLETVSEDEIFYLPEIIRNILNYLPLRDLLSTMRVSLRWHNIACEVVLQRLKTHFIQPLDWNSSDKATLQYLALFEPFRMVSTQIKLLEKPSLLRELLRDACVATACSITNQISRFSNYNRAYINNNIRYKTLPCLILYPRSVVQDYLLKNKESKWPIFSVKSECDDMDDFWDDADWYEDCYEEEEDDDIYWKYISELQSRKLWDFEINRIETPINLGGYYQLARLRKSLDAYNASIFVRYVRGMIQEKPEAYDFSWITTGPACASPYYHLGYDDNFGYADPTLFNLVLTTMVVITEDILLYMADTTEASQDRHGTAFFCGPFTGCMQDMSLATLCQKLEDFSQ